MERDLARMWWQATVTHQPGHIKMYQKKLQTQIQQSRRNMQGLPNQQR